MQIGVRWAGLECVDITQMEVEDGAVTESVRVYHLRCVCGTVVPVREDMFPGKQKMRWCGRIGCEYAMGKKVLVGGAPPDKQPVAAGIAGAAIVAGAPMHINEIVAVRNARLEEAERLLANERASVGERLRAGELLEDLRAGRIDQRGVGRPVISAYGKRKARSVCLASGVWAWLRELGKEKEMSAQQMVGWLMEREYARSMSERAAAQQVAAQQAQLTKEKVKEI